jgi:hypothetical protein
MTSRRVWFAALAILAGCASASPSALPSRPPVPDGWIITSKPGVSIAAPSEWGGDIGGDPASILISSLIPPSNKHGVGLIAIGPRGENQPDLPFTDAGLGDWLLESVTPEPPDAYSRSIVLLPAGRAVMVRASYHTATPDGTDIVALAIPTIIGVAYLTINVDRALADRYGPAMEIIPFLLDLRSVGAD